MNHIFQWSRSPGKEGSHFNPYSNLFSPGERRDVLTSTLCWGIMLSVLLYLSLTMGPLFMLKLYGVPYLVISLSHFLYTSHTSVGYLQPTPK